MMSRLTKAIARNFASVLSPAGRGARLPIFCYHQVLEQRDPLRPGEPDRADFAADINIIAGVFNVLPLQEAARRIISGSLPARAACITFDDGYANNHEFAAPVLEAAGVPATFFVTSSAVDDGVMWNDLIIEAVARCESSPQLKIAEGFEVVASGVASGGVELIESVINQIKYWPMEERLALAENMYRANVAGAPPRLMMDREMVADLARRGFDIGGHTMHHPILKELPDDRARDEIESCGHWVQDVTGRRPKTFAYPNGRPDKDFTDAHALMVANAGYEVAVSTVWAVADARTNPFAMPRIGPWWRQGRSLLSGLLRAYLANQKP